MALSVVSGPELPALRVSHVQKTYRTRSGTIRAVEDVSFDLAAGQILAFLGPNGAGKTTTIKMAAGLVTPDAGQVAVSGRALHRQHDWATARLGAVLEGSRNLYWRLTVLENLLYWATVRRVAPGEARRRADALLSRAGLLERGANTVQTLSRGMQQKVALCQALMHDPAVLLLDEPTLGLDFESSEGVKQLVRELAGEGKAVLLTTHQLDVAEELSDRVAIVRRGRLVLEGPTRRILHEHSRPMLEVVAARPWTPEALGRLSGVRHVVVSEDTIQVHIPDGDFDRLAYRVLERLNPHPLLRVERHRAALVDVFQEVVEGAARGGGEEGS